MICAWKVCIQYKLARPQNDDVHVSGLEKK